MKILLGLAAALLFFTGCASDPAAKISKFQIKTVGVDPKIVGPGIRYRDTRNDASLNAQLTSLTLSAMKSKMIKRLATVMRENSINVPDMVRSNFVQAVTGLGYQYSENQPDATFVLGLQQYGFDDSQVFYPNAPFAVIEARLVKADGKVIWRGSSGNSGREVLIGHAFEKNDPQLGVKNLNDYEGNPEKLRHDWEIVVHKAVGDLLRAAKNAQ